MAKIKNCKHCGSETHLSLSCFNAPRKHLKRVAIKSTTNRKKSAKTPRQSAKDKAWKAFSDYIRLRDSLATTGTPDACICVTCSVRGDNSWKPYKSIQAGHAVGGRGNAVLFHEELVNGQCGYCNRKPPMGLGGDYGNYAIFLVEKYGIDHARELQRLRHNTEVKYKVHDFIEVEQKYKHKRLALLDGLC